MYSWSSPPSGAGSSATRTASMPVPLAAARSTAQPAIRWRALTSAPSVGWSTVSSTWHACASAAPAGRAAGTPPTAHAAAIASAARCTPRRIPSPSPGLLPRSAARKPFYKRLGAIVGRRAARSAGRAGYEAVTGALRRGHTAPKHSGRDSGHANYPPTEAGSLAGAARRHRAGERRAGSERRPRECCYDRGPGRRHGRGPLPGGGEVGGAPTSPSRAPSIMSNVAGRSTLQSCAYGIKLQLCPADQARAPARSAAPIVIDTEPKGAASARTDAWGWRGATAARGARRGAAVRADRRQSRLPTAVAPLGRQGAVAEHHPRLLARGPAAVCRQAWRAVRHLAARPAGGRGRPAPDRLGQPRVRPGLLAGRRLPGPRPRNARLPRARQPRRPRPGPAPRGDSRRDRQPPQPRHRRAPRLPPGGRAPRRRVAVRPLRRSGGLRDAGSRVAGVEEEKRKAVHPLSTR